ncbi:membrane protein [Mycoplasma capricolum]|uniref:Membrane protein n=3 Tax=Mycoplasma capricolum subsp. capricolum TaxID=40479 RepID=A0A0C3A3R5_MYCCA|nr:membrane protein [Mycoplasma capricolum]ABC01770.1 membrane protein, putative [Mycoplasma capricolum subsp. capricolum ATCC 27343]KEZ19015.1 Hypothetical protein, predicted transmembrane protein [Mycoplasma capricolum subsp. capricolum 14232]KIM14126.1 membrane protein [Mycoplasma capricolum subsp. capricolum]KKW61478.1 putative transmembrane protein [Mycoplasma capricolum subsp. capricolum]WBX36165.1 hypothetical protein NO343_04385 [Mycoplasma capricolum subsp. capricolum]
MQTSTILMIVLLVFVIGFVIWSTITGKKANKKEKEKRYNQVRSKIKEYILKNEHKKNLRIEFEKVYARKGAEYKYRDVFDVIVQLIEPKTQKVIETRAYEVEGLTTKINKSQYNTEWIVNNQIDLEETKKRIAIGEKTIKLTKAEKQKLRQLEKMQAKKLAQEEKEQLKKAKEKQKTQKGSLDIYQERKLNISNKKFVPSRSKSN